MMKRNVKTIGIAVLALALLFGLSSCGPKNGIIGDPVKGLMIEYSLDKDQAITYIASSKTNINMEQMGQTFDIVNKSDMSYTITGKGKDDAGNFISDFKIDKFEMEMEGLPGMAAPDLSHLQEHVLKFVFSPNGKKIELSDSDSLIISMGQMGGGDQPLTALIQGVLATMPDGIRKVGDQWKETRKDTTQRNGMDVTTDTETTYTFEAVETVNGYECLKIVSSSTGTLDGAGEPQGMNMTIEGDIETNTEIYFAYREQILVKMVAKTFNESTIAISGPMDMTMPMVTETEATVEIKK